MIPVLFEKDEINFLNNGLGSLPNVVESYAKQTANSEYELFIVYPTLDEVEGISNKIWEELKIPERQILYKPSHGSEPHAFRIYDYEINTEDETISVYARSRAYDLAGNPIKDVVVKSKTPQAAMNAMKAALMEPTDFEFYSDITTPSSTTWTKRSGLSTIMGQTGSLIQIWGGEVFRENRKISLLRRAGKDNVTSLRLGKNINQLEYDFSADGMVTAIIPYCTFTTDGEDAKEITLVGDTVKSPKFDNYRLPYYEFVEFTEEDGVVDLLTLNNAASNWFNEKRGIDEPNVSISVDMMDIAESTEYGDILKKLETVNVFDTLSVYIEKYNIDLLIKVNTLKYDGIGERNLEVDLGNVTKSLFESFVSPDFKTLEEQINEAKKIGLTAQGSANGKNTNYHGHDDPNQLEVVGQNGDIYFREIFNERQMWEFYNGQWNLIIDTSENTSIKNSVDEAMAAAEGAQAEAEASYTNALKEASEYADKLVTVDALKAKVLTSNVITSDMIKVDSLLATKMFSDYAFINVLTTEEAFINGVKAIEISADKITAGEIDFGIINGININASNISGGYLDLSKGISIGNSSAPVLGVNSKTGEVEMNISKMTINTIPVATKEDLDAIELTPGKSAYDIAKENGYTGTEAQWVESLKGKDGANGTAGTKGADGKTSYLHIAYATSANGSTGFSTTVSTGKTFIGQYTDFEEEDSENYTKYSWSKFKGENGYTPVKGTDYFDGKDGQSSYVWVRYSQNANGNPMVTSPTGAKYMGIATTTVETAPTAYSDYTWSLIKGTDGVRGETGADGRSSYMHIKYSDDGTTFTSNNGETEGKWIGILVDFVETDSLTFSKYTWNKVAGEDGSDAKLLYLSATAETMTFNADNSPNPTTQTISFTANLQNTTGTATFTATPYNGTTALTNITLGGSGNTRTLTQAQFPATATRILVKVTLGNLTDTVSVMKLKNGQDGETGAKGETGSAGANGKNAVVGYLTNESVTFPATSAGVVSSGNLALANGTFKVFDGLTDKTGSSVTYSVVSSTGATGAITTAGIYSVSAITADNASIVFRAVYSGVNIDKILTLSKSKAGLNGYTPVKGTDYFDGKDGQDGLDGESNFLWVRYSQNSNGNPMTDSPTNAKYVGLATTNTSTAPSAYAAYKWSLVKGTDGINGEKGANGQTSYLHIKYSNNGGLTFTANGGETVGEWIGTYVDFTEADSTSVSKYTWNKVKGEPGEQGPQGLRGLQGPQGTQGIQGKPGTDGVSSYTHIAYATSSTGANFSHETFGSATYIGMYVNQTSTSSSVPSDYQWTLIKGADGTNGIQGPKGTDGKTPYFHTAWATSVDGSTGFSTTISANKTHIGTYTDFVKADSDDHTKYDWVQIKGDKGDTGPKGATGSQGPKGDTGTSVSSVTEYYLATSSSSGVTSTTSGWTTSIQTMTATNKYLWNYEKINFSDGTSQPTVPVIIGAYGQKGDTGGTGATGRSITGITEHYLASNLATGVTRTTSGWSTSMQQTTPEKRYLWNYETITWSSGTITTYVEPIVIGVHGLQGPQGPQGIQGPKGANGTSQYIHIRYSTLSNGNPMTTTPSASTMYIGIANTTSSTAPTGYASYTWSLYKGEKGDKGVPGANGKNGTTTYTWIKYADTDTGVGMSDSPSGKKYIGMAFNKTTATESSTASQYTWSLMPQNIEVGAKNLLLKSNEEITNSLYPTATYKMSEKMIVGQEYTIRLWGTLGAGKTNFSLYLNGGSISLGALKNNGDGTFSSTFIGKDSGVTTGDILHIYPFASTTVVNSTITKIKLEKGSVATDWTEAPEDIQAQIDEKASNESLNEVASGIGEIQNDLMENYAGKGDIERLDEAITASNTAINEARADSIKDINGIDNRTSILEQNFGDYAVDWNFIRTSVRLADEGMRISKAGEKTGLLIQNDKISFVSDDNEVAYISGQELYITQGTFLDNVKIGQHRVSTLPSDKTITVIRYEG